MSIFIFALSIAPWFIFGIDRVLLSGSFDTIPSITVYSLVVSLIGALLGGILCAFIGRSRNAVFVLAVISFLLGTVNAIAQLGKPEPEPRRTGVTVMEAVQKRKEATWYAFLIPLLGAGGMLTTGLALTKPSKYPDEYETQTSIDAKPQHVWGILTNAAGYKNWNPEIIAIDGKIARNEKITAHVRLGSGAIRKVGLKITEFQDGVRMKWVGGLPLGLFIGTRTFTVGQSGDGTIFRMHLSMKGPLAPMILNSVGDRQPEVDSFTNALKIAAVTIMRD